MPATSPSVEITAQAAIDKAAEVDGIIRDAWREPYAGGCILHGRIYSDRKGRFPEGYPIHTSLVLKELPGDVFHTRNSIYRVENWGPMQGFLGLPDAKSYRLMRVRFDHPAGTICYPAAGYDYGLARDDEAFTGIPHKSMTLDPDGGAPCFTVPLVDLEPVTS